MNEIDPKKSVPLSPEDEEKIQTILQQPKDQAVISRSPFEGKSMFGRKYFVKVAQKNLGENKSLEHRVKSKEEIVTRKISSSEYPGGNLPAMDEVVGSRKDGISSRSITHPKIESLKVTESPRAMVDVTPKTVEMERSSGKLKLPEIPRGVTPAGKPMEAPKVQPKPTEIREVTESTSTAPGQEREFQDLPDENDLFDLYGKKIYGQAYKNTHGSKKFKEYMAEEIRAETLMRLVNYIRQVQAGEKEWNGKADFGTYAFRIAANVAKDIGARNKTRKETPLVIKNEGDYETSEPADDKLDGVAVQEAFENSETAPVAKKMLDDAINSLSDQVKEIFLMRIMEGLTEQQVHQKTGVSIANIGGAMYRARHALKKALNKEQFKALLGTGKTVESLGVRE
jgi:RNA polymerase sigma factor (sigma-70 family)